MGGEADNHSVGEENSCENGVVGKLRSFVVNPLCFVYLVGDLC